MDCLKNTLKTFVLTSLLVSPVFASEMDSLLEMGLEDLLNMQVSLASRREEPAFTTPSAIYVITSEDIRRSGLNSVPELLRLVPGMHVGRIDAHTWSINSRANNSRFSDTMLVQIDGRTVYTPLFAGVYWDVQDIMLEDIDRIEVIRGAGASLWGANAVTGIINIVSKHARDTQGGLVSIGAGQGDRKYSASARYGFADNDLYARFYVRKFLSDHGRYLPASQSQNNGFFPVNSEAFDEYGLSQAGFRVDWLKGHDEFRLQGDIYQGEFKDILYRSSMPFFNSGDVEGGNLHFNWKRQLSTTSNMSLQVYYDFTERKDSGFEELRNKWDIDFQHAIQSGIHQFVWGFGYTRDSDETKQVNTFGLSPANKTTDLYSLFIQDQIEIQADKLYLTVGSKFEHNDYSGYEVQPTVRLRWSPAENHTLWAAASRAVRTQNRDSDAYLDFGFIVPIGLSQSYNVVSHEIGYRTRQGNWYFDVTAFQNDYSEETSTDHYHGAEADIRFQPSDDWNLSLSLTHHRGERLGDEAVGFPENQAVIRSLWNISPKWEFDLAAYLYEGGRTTSIDLPPYSRFDARLGWKHSDDLELSLALTNLFDDNHVEEGESQRITTSPDRSIFLKAVIQYE